MKLRRSIVGLAVSFVLMAGLVTYAEGQGPFAAQIQRALDTISLAVANIADGTDGELITWDSSGVATTVAVGTATHVLTSNGAGAAPTFQAAGGGGGDTYVVKTADEVVNNSATPQADDHLIFAASASVEYAVHTVIFLDSNASQDIQFTWDVPTGTTGIHGINCEFSDKAKKDAFTTKHNPSTDGTGVLTMCELWAYMAISTTPGTVSLLWAQNVAGANNTTLHLGSWLTYKQLD